MGMTKRTVDDSVQDWRAGSVPAKRVIDTAQAAAYCNLGKSTFDKYRLTGGGPAFLKLGRRVVYDIADLDEWLAAHRRRSTAEAA